jgi:raffinose/stachyose/melibiose transport system permease protein
MAVHLPVARARTAGTERAGRRRLVRQRTVAGWLCLAPFLVVNLLVIVGPSVATVYYSFTDWTGVGGAAFVGLENFRQLAATAISTTPLRTSRSGRAFFLTVRSRGPSSAPTCSRRSSGSRSCSGSSTHPLHDRQRRHRVGLGEHLRRQPRPGPPARRRRGLALEGVALLGNKQTALPAVAWVDTWHWWGFLVIVFLRRCSRSTPSCTTRCGSTAAAGGASSGTSPCRAAGRRSCSSS